MGNHDDDFGFAKWALDNNAFKWNVPKRIAEYLVNRIVPTGKANFVAYSAGYDVLATDLYELLRLSEPEAWSRYCAMLEDYEETQARLDNARGKRY